MYGIAIDIEPKQNPCCGCGDAVAKPPQCKLSTGSTYDKMKMPASWVAAFKKYGFYWLGDDPMRDTMHFEFLGDPAKIVTPN